MNLIGRLLGLGMVCAVLAGLSACGAFVVFEPDEYYSMRVGTIAWSPDQKQLAFDYQYYQTPPGDTAPRNLLNIYTVNTDGTDLKQIYASEAKYDYSLGLVDWIGPENEQKFFIVQDDQLLLADVKQPEQMEAFPFAEVPVCPFNRSQSSIVVNQPVSFATFRQSSRSAIIAPGQEDRAISLEYQGDQIYPTVESCSPDGQIVFFRLRKLKTFDDQEELNIKRVIVGVARLNYEQAVLEEPMILDDYDDDDAIADDGSLGISFIAWLNTHRLVMTKSIRDSKGQYLHSKAYYLDYDTGKEESAPDFLLSITPSISPDHQWVAYRDGTGGIMIARPDGSQKRRVVALKELPLSEPEYL